MSVREYIGARYVPVFADPIDWDGTKTYEPLTVVYHQGNSYTSRQAVPAGIDISNTTYWALTGNYNAQIEQYRAEVAAFDGRITTNANAIATETAARENADTALGTRIDANASAITAEATARADADTALGGRIDANASAITAETTARETADTALNGRISKLEIPNDPVQYGADPTGASDSSAAIAACIAANYGGSVIFTPGRYKITEPIKTPYELEDRVSIDFANSVIFAESDITFLQVGYLNPSETQYYAEESMATWYSNFNFEPTSGSTKWIVEVYERYLNARFSHFQCENAYKFGRIGIGSTTTHVGDSTWTDFELNSELPARTGSIAFKCDNTSDNEFNNGRIIGFEHAFETAGGGNLFKSIHATVAGTYAQTENCHFLDTTAQMEKITMSYADGYGKFINYNGTGGRTKFLVINSTFFNTTQSNVIVFDVSNAAVDESYFLDNEITLPASRTTKYNKTVNFGTMISAESAIGLLNPAHYRGNILNYDPTTVSNFDPMLLCENEIHPYVSVYTPSANYDSYVEIGSFLCNAEGDTTVEIVISWNYRIQETIHNFNGTQPVHLKTVKYNENSSYTGNIGFYAEPHSSDSNDKLTLVHVLLKYTSTDRTISPGVGIVNVTNGRSQMKWLNNDKLGNVVSVSAITPQMTVSF